MLQFITNTIKFITNTIKSITNTIKSDNNKLFYGVLIFLGLRRNTTIKQKDPKNKFIEIVQRNIIHQQRTKQTKTPRNLTREIYKRRYNKDLSPNNSPIQEDRGEIKININIEKSIKRKEKRKRFFKVLISWTYTTFILCILCVSPIYTVVNITKNQYNNSFLYSSLFFLLIEPTQYVLSIVYFGTPHFEEFYINKKNFDVQCFPTTNQFIILILTILLVLGIVNFLFISNIFIDNLDTPVLLSGNKSIDFTIRLFSWIYGRLTLYINLLCFSLVFCKHCKIIQDYVKKLENENISKANILSINIITQDILAIRNELEESINKFISIFSIFTILGAIGFGFFIERVKVGNFESFPWNELIIYIIVQFIFIIIIYRVSSYQKDLIDYVRQPAFVEKFLKRYTIRDVKEKFEDPIMISLNLDEENSSQLDWIILDRLLNEKWAEFNVMGIDISNGELIKRGIALVSIIVAFNTLINN